ncbi:MAG TPA: hypothetical protein VE964_05870 [Myxococcales bacterium]|nr:hypothetical protein [Myxococcales bacterium]
MALGDLLAWWNLVFLLPGAAGLCLAFLSRAGRREDEAPPRLGAEASLLASYGTIGLVANQVLPGMPARLPVSLAVAAGGSLLVSVLVSWLVARASPGEETSASFESLIGCSGEVVSLHSKAEGTARVHDPLGKIQDVQFKNLAATPLRAGERVVVARVESDQQLCLVVAVTGEEPLAKKEGDAP